MQLNFKLAKYLEKDVYFIKGYCPCGGDICILEKGIFAEFNRHGMHCGECGLLYFNNEEVLQIKHIRTIGGIFALYHYLKTLNKI